MGRRVYGNAPVALTRAAVWNVAYQYVAIGLALVHGILLVPLYLPRIPVALYGSWLATGSILAWVDLADPGLSGALQQRVAFHAGAGDLRRVSSAVGTGLLFNAVVSCLPLVAWPLADSVPALVGAVGSDAAALASAFRLALVATSAAFASYALTSVNVGLHLSLAVGVIYIVGAFAGIGATVALLLHGAGLSAIPAGLLVKSAVVFVGDGARLVVWWRANRAPAPRVSKEAAGDLLHLLGFTFGARLGAVLLEKMEALLVATWFSPAAATSYVLSGRAFEPLKMVVSRAAHGLVPGLAHLIGQGRSSRAAELVSRAIIVVTAITAVGTGVLVAMNERFMRLWVGPTLYGGIALTAALGVASALSALTAATSHFVFAAGGIRRTAAATVCEGMVKIALAVMLVRHLGVLSLPVASACATLAVSAWYLPAVLKKVLPSVAIRSGRWWKAALSATASGCAGALVAVFTRGWSGFGGWLSLAIATAMLGVLFFGAVLVIDKAVRAEALSAWVRLRHPKVPDAAGTGG